MVPARPPCAEPPRTLSILCLCWGHPQGWGPPPRAAASPLSPPASSPSDDAHPMGEPPGKPPRARRASRRRATTVPPCQRRGLAPGRCRAAGTCAAASPCPDLAGGGGFTPCQRPRGVRGRVTLAPSGRKDGVLHLHRHAEEERAAAARGSFLAHGAAGQDRTQGGRKEFLPTRVAKPRQRDALHPWKRPRLKPGSALSIPIRRLRLALDQRLPRPHPAGSPRG